MFVNTLPAKSAPDIVVMTLLFLTLTTNAIESTKTNASLLPFCAAISTPLLSLSSFENFFDFFCEHGGYASDFC